jgi:hypothetical protein
MRWLVMLVTACSLHSAPSAPSCPDPIYEGQQCDHDETCASGSGSATFTCSCSGGAWSCDADDPACPAEPPVGRCGANQGPCDYPQADGLTSSCSCQFGNWWCSSCPLGFQDPTSTCTPGTGCDYEDWEHGCSCGCGDDGHWHCTPETIGSYCGSLP